MVTRSWRLSPAAGVYPPAFGQVPVGPSLARINELALPKTVNMLRPGSFAVRFTAPVALPICTEKSPLVGERSMPACDSW